jgi:glyoxylase-like metal-dependent hydrolase (beta-lactamase superfamily II)
MVIALEGRQLMSLFEIGSGPADDQIYDLYSLKFARQPSRRASSNFLNSAPDQHDGVMPMDFYIWIAHNRHRTVVVDTGFNSSSPSAAGREMICDPVDALEALGMPASAVRHILYTHLHWDHAGNIGRFPAARFHVQEAEMQFATGPCMCEPSLRNAFDVEDVIAMVRSVYASRVQFHDGDATAFPGIDLILMPGHSVGMQAVRVVTRRGPVLLASDVSHFYANFMLRHPFRLTVDMMATLRSYNLLMDIAGSVDRIIPGHDPKVQLIYPSIEVNGIQLSCLHEEPSGMTDAELARIDNY